MGSDWWKIPVLMLLIGSGLWNVQGTSILGLSVFFGASDGARDFLETYQAPVHPIARLPRSDR